MYRCVVLEINANLSSETQTMCGHVQSTTTATGKYSNFFIVLIQTILLSCGYVTVFSVIHYWTLLDWVIMCVYINNTIPYHSFITSYWVTHKPFPRCFHQAQPAPQPSSQMIMLASQKDLSVIIACRRFSNYIFIIDLTPGFNGLGKDNYKMRREKLKFEIWCALYHRLYGNYFSF